MAEDIQQLLTAFDALEQKFIAAYRTHPKRRASKRFREQYTAAVGAVGKMRKATQAFEGAIEVLALEAQ